MNRSNKIPSSNAIAVLGKLVMFPSATTLHLCQATGISIRDVNEALSELQGFGLARNIGRGKWKPSPIAFDPEEAAHRAEKA